MNDKEIIADAEDHWRVYFKRLLDLARRLESANAKLRAFVEALATCPHCLTRRCVGCEPNCIKDQARQLLEDVDR